MDHIKLKSKEEIEKSFFHIPFWIAPDKNLFLSRSDRFKKLAKLEKSDWKLYLQLLSELSRVQHGLLADADAVVPELKRNDSASLLNVYSTAIPFCFTPMLNALYERSKSELSAHMEQTWQRLLAMPVPEQEALALRILQQEIKENDQEYSIWVHAVLQVVWTYWAMQLQETDVPSRDERVQCPCCGSDAVGSVILKSGEQENLRYLHCNLCNSRWNALRAKCTFCGNTKDMTLQSVEGATEGALHGASGETCDVCQGYRKMFSLSKEQHADPVADDLGSLALDMMLGEKGYSRGGANPFLVMEKEARH
ncbi:formate dehydrogenase accessory protein FdhE [Advenella sp. WQ 585]|uniref:Formate dehydrogenase accessory protein FdhE n=1 Tax=Advenella mandrilli TaxID=2800330 RepID=A0ABS1ECY9_9BURK|nr:formate dehydrogenase accessory protein FdhE [Advenella mandrilli]MBK1781464.1 formate dehydrogenase accessory protein FdhE [Advenella mandrilli]